MTDVGLASIMVGVTQILGILFILFLVLKKNYSWFFLFSAQASWFIYSIFLDKFDIIALIVICLSIAALSFTWKNSEFGFSTMKEKSICFGITLIAMGSCFMSPDYNVLPFNEAVFQILTLEGMAFLAFKTLDGWVLLILANLFYWQETVSDTITVIVIGTIVYSIGLYNWKKELT